jgi:hypothetical protein
MGYQWQELEILMAVFMFIFHSLTLHTVYPAAKGQVPCLLRESLFLERATLPRVRVFKLMRQEMFLREVK